MSRSRKEITKNKLKQSIRTCNKIRRERSGVTCGYFRPAYLEHFDEEYRNAHNEIEDIRNKYSFDNLSRTAQKRKAQARWKKEQSRREKQKERHEASKEILTEEGNLLD